MAKAEEIPELPSTHSQSKLIREGYHMITETLREPLHELHCEAEITPQYFVLFDVFPFACGAQRLAFRGSIYERNGSRSPKFHVHVVVKMEMATPDLMLRPVDERTRMCADEATKTVRRHDLTARLVHEWRSLGINKSVHVLTTERITVTTGCALSRIDNTRFPLLSHLYARLSLDEVLYKGAVGTVEDYLPGKFTKFLNNDGRANSAITANFPAAFAHWTWVSSGGDLMISDIQGVRNGMGYVLTDPCVHSVRDSEGFGASDLGLAGVEEFFQKHTCNELCKDLGLEGNARDLDVGHLLRTRTVKDEEGGTPGVRAGSAANDAERQREREMRSARMGVGLQRQGRFSDDDMGGSDLDEIVPGAEASTSERSGRARSVRGRVSAARRRGVVGNGVDDDDEDYAVFGAKRRAFSEVRESGVIINGGGGSGDVGKGERLARRPTFWMFDRKSSSKDVLGGSVAEASGADGEADETYRKNRLLGSVVGGVTSGALKRGLSGMSGLFRRKRVDRLERKWDKAERQERVEGVYNLDYDKEGVDKRSRRLLDKTGRESRRGVSGQLLSK